MVFLIGVSFAETQFCCLAVQGIRSYVVFLLLRVSSTETHFYCVAVYACKYTQILGKGQTYLISGSCFFLAKSIITMSDVLYGFGRRFLRSKHWHPCVVPR